VFISGDLHINEIYEIVLPSGGSKKAPEFVCSPMGNNSDLKDARTITGERKWNFSSEIEDGSYWGFTAITIDTTNSNPNGNWTLSAKYRRFDNGTDYKTQVYTLQNDEFVYV
jgi:hypothetical protein